MRTDTERGKRDLMERRKGELMRCKTQRQADNHKEKEREGGNVPHLKGKGGLDLTLNFTRKGDCSFLASSLTLDSLQKREAQV